MSSWGDALRNLLNAPAKIAGTLAPGGGGGGAAGGGGGAAASGESAPPAGEAAPLTPLNNPANAPTWQTVGPWAGAFAVYAVVMVGLSESDSYGDAAAALAWLVAVGAAMYWWTELDVSLAELLGRSGTLSGHSAAGG